MTICDLSAMLEDWGRDWGTRVPADQVRFAYRLVGGGGPLDAWAIVAPSPADRSTAGS
jgi:hypothetical protein